MNKVAKRQFDVLVIGGGPAGIAAAASAAEHGRHVGVVDDNPALGGQIWRGEVADCTSEASSWVARLHRSGVELLCGTRVFDRPEPNVLHAEGNDSACELKFEKLILATGARERFLPFPGWTLPNVMGAGALQALVKSGLPIAGKRVVAAGTGPLLLAVAAYLKKHGADVATICEQAPWTSLMGFSLSLVPHPQKISQGLSLRKDLAGVPFATDCWPIAASGEGVLNAVSILRRGKIEKIPCDYLACGFHLVPNTELAQLLGCRLKGGYVHVDEYQQTSMAGVFCAGEPTGIGGVELSLIEGQIAGHASVGDPHAAKNLFSSRKKFRKFARALDRTFALRSELKSLAVPETIVCRCEDVSFASIKRFASWRDAKLQTRCGMGPCQGRVCGPALDFLLNWQHDSVRPPIFPVSVENLGLLRDEQEQRREAMRGTQ
jgi:NADPH-dependent 2,4-dienoyl-CoA reductase/sulfur reductase-like enzyme